MVPKRAVDVKSCQIVRFLQLTQSSIIPVAYHVQRKVSEWDGGGGKGNIPYIRKRNIFMVENVCGGMTAMYYRHCLRTVIGKIIAKLNNCALLNFRAFRIYLWLKNCGCYTWSHYTIQDTHMRITRNSLRLNFCEDWW